MNDTSNAISIQEYTASDDSQNREKIFDGMVDEVIAKTSERQLEGSLIGDRHGNYVVNDAGLYFDPPDGDVAWISSPIWPVAHLRDENGKSHSLLLKVHDGEREHFWAMPRRIIAKSADLNDILLDLGQKIPLLPSLQKHLQNFLMSAKPEKKMRCISKCGWHGEQYVFPDGAVFGGGGADEGVYPIHEVCPKGVELKGSLSGWQENVLKLCVGNSRLIFSVGTAFAGLCMNLLDFESGGFNLIGASSRGKTRCLKLATTVIGSWEYKRSWKTTSNGLEGICALHNDSLLPLDEFGQSDADEIGEITYMLSAGVGKQRAHRDGSARECRTWRILLLSTGEVGLEDHARQGKKRTKAGQLTRIVDIPAETGLHGCFEELHGCSDGKEFSDAIDKACRLAYGTPAREFIGRIINYGVEEARHNLRFLVEDFSADCSRNCDGQVKRVADRFGLVFAALVLSIKLGVTNGVLSEEMVRDGVLRCFQSWLEKRGTFGDFESHDLIERVKGVLSENSDSKFASTDDLLDKKLRNALWGYRVGAKFYVLSKAFKEQLCNGFDIREATKILKNSGILIPGADKNSRLIRIPAHYKQPDRFYELDLGQAQDV